MKTLEKLLKVLDKSQTETAEQMGISQQYLSQIANGDRRLTYQTARRFLESVELEGLGAMELLFYNNGEITSRDVQQFLIYQGVEIPSDEGLNTVAEKVEKEINKKSKEGDSHGQGL